MLAAPPWDLILVDEAHHARRKDFLQPIYRPNRLLELLNDLNTRTKAILLRTATPMQVHPLEVWDLLKVLGLGGKWGAAEENFMHFYMELMKPFDEVDWDFVFGMVRDYLDLGGKIDERFAERVRAKLGFVDWSMLQQLPRDVRPSRTVRAFERRIQPFVYEMAKQHTPLQDFMFRSTRELLRKYVQQGLLKEGAPTRDPRLVWIPMRADEMRLYLRIEEYISEFYQKYEDARTGLGFVMMVYRRRLTSSFYAVQRSLKRRLDFLQGRAEQAFDDDDLEQADLEQDVTDILDEDQTALYQQEIEYVESFLADLQRLSMQDSKTEQLIHDLDEIFRQRETAMVFTQYADTMDYLRDKLRAVYGQQVACYSGRGGEVWNGIAWVKVTKEEIKQAFRLGEDVKMLVCTEAASEGLNLQTCGVLINYDMPWNPMRVEQRIGRIDRIGQVCPEVWIFNYFYEDTVEAKVYRALEQRINWFEGVVGELQPILARVGKAIERVVMASPTEQATVLSEELSDIERQIGQRDSDILNVYETFEASAPRAASTAPVSLVDLENSITDAPSLQSRILPSLSAPELYQVSLDGDGTRVATFDPAVFDQHPGSVDLLSYGNRSLEQLVASVARPEEDARRGVLRLSSAEPVPLVAYYAFYDHRGPVRLETAEDLGHALTAAAAAQGWTDTAAASARDDFAARVSDSADRIQEHLQLQLGAPRSALVQQAWRVLQRAGGVEPFLDSLEVPTTSSVGAPNEARLQRLARRGYPFGALVQLVSGQGEAPPAPLDALQQTSPDRVRAIWSRLQQEGKTVLAQWSALHRQPEGWPPAAPDVQVQFLVL